MLHTLSHANIDITKLLAIVAAKDAVLLWQDGVLIGVKHPEFIKQLQNQRIPVYALDNDIQARGLAPYLEQYIQVITMTQVISVTEQCTPQFKH
ncbi:sulfurtransferase complex subunit TusB [Zophobihabitans entericus]|uniref:Sulfurtransferase complex subunit TusB n=1 Tax=Zophobihabitans entericus TaxID=1635327 RepID=A0A6G9I8G6_9GAMM|nr:sulfurtransferase complex subunit TusB [Zophobihabitans entericus]QIQ20508.1 sulfurtransferase complex subunit TusB [Zophobihabitans entericus]